MSKITEKPDENDLNNNINKWSVKEKLFLISFILINGDSDWSLISDSLNKWMKLTSTSCSSSTNHTKRSITQCTKQYKLITKNYTVKHGMVDLKKIYNDLADERIKELKSSIISNKQDYNDICKEIEQILRFEDNPEDGPDSCSLSSLNKLAQIWIKIKNNSKDEQQNTDCLNTPEDDELKSLENLLDSIKRINTTTTSNDEDNVINKNLEKIFTHEIEKINRERREKLLAQERERQLEIEREKEKQLQLQLEKERLEKELQAEQERLENEKRLNQEKINMENKENESRLSENVEKSGNQTETNQTVVSNDVEMIEDADAQVKPQELSSKQSEESKSETNNENETLKSEKDRTDELNSTTEEKKNEIDQETNQNTSTTTTGDAKAGKDIENKDEVKEITIKIEEENQISTDDVEKSGSEDDVPLVKYQQGKPDKDKSVSSSSSVSSNTGIEWKPIIDNNTKIEPVENIEKLSENQAQNDSDKSKIPESVGSSSVSSVINEDSTENYENQSNKSPTSNQNKQSANEEELIFTPKINNNDNTSSQESIVKPSTESSALKTSARRLPARKQTGSSSRSNKKQDLNSVINELNLKKQADAQQQLAEKEQVDKQQKQLETTPTTTSTTESAPTTITTPTASATATVETTPEESRVLSLRSTQNKSRTASTSSSGTKRRSANSTPTPTTTKNEPVNNEEETKAKQPTIDTGNLVSIIKSEPIQINADTSTTTNENADKQQGSEPVAAFSCSSSTSSSISNTNPPATSYKFEDEKAYRAWKKSIMMVLNNISCHKHATIFMQPVKDEIAPGYSNVVFRPMDLSTIKKNIENGAIKSTREFQRDIMLMFTNAIMYNSSNHDVHKISVEMYKEVLNDIEQLLNAQEAMGSSGSSVCSNDDVKMLRFKEIRSSTASDRGNELSEQKEETTNATSSEEIAASLLMKSSSKKDNSSSNLLSSDLNDASSIKSNSSVSNSTSNTSRNVKQSTGTPSNSKKRRPSTDSSQQQQTPQQTSQQSKSKRRKTGR